MTLASFVIHFWHIVLVDPHIFPTCDLFLKKKKNYGYGIFLYIYGFCCYLFCLFHISNLVSGL